MAKLMFREDKKWKTVEEIDKVAGGSLVGMPKLEPKEVQSRVDTTTKTEGSSSIESTVSPEDWKLKQTPSKYLANSPKGPQAELAKQLVDAGLGDITVDDTTDEEEEEDNEEDEEDED